MLEARHKNEQGKWQVDDPTVRVELWLADDYLLAAAQSSMGFPVEESSTGAWSTPMTFNQAGGWVFPYFVYAVPLDAFNTPHDEAADTILVAIVSS
jgi:hypothetical protein